MQTNDIKVNFLGRREMLPPDVREAVESMERDTAGYQTCVLHSDASHRGLTFPECYSLARAVLNVCCPYTSRDEVTTAVKDTIHDVEKGIIPPSYVLIETLTSSR